MRSPRSFASTASWVDVIQGASERIATLAAGRARSPDQDTPSTTPADQAAPAAAARTWTWARARSGEAGTLSDALDLIGSLPPGSHEDPDALLLRAVLLTNNGRLDESEASAAVSRSR